MRWRLAALLGVVLLAAGAGVVRWRWPRAPRKDPMRLALLGSALNEFHAKHYDRATAILNRRAAEVAPTSLDWMLRARIAEALGLLAEAIDDLKHIPDSDAISSQAWLKAGQIEVARNRARAAEAAYRRALLLNPDQLQAYRELAYLFALERRKAECDAQFRALARRIRMGHIMAFAWCQNYCELWDPKEAIPILSRFIAEDPSDRVSRLALASCYETSNQLDRSAEVLSPLPDSDPDARALRIVLAMDRGEIELAQKLARDGPAEHLGLNVCRGKLAFASDASQAAAYYRSALREDPEDRDALQGLGFALRKLGDPKATEYLDLAALHDKLRRTIQDSVTTIQTDLKLFAKLGRICESLNRLDEARIWYQLAIDRDPLDTQSQEALSRVTHSARENRSESQIP
ncbi:MAG: tetratricopeptide repeat protein [Isosphaeraceae bacterium]